MVYNYPTLYRLAYFNLVFIVIVNGLSVNLSVLKAVATAFLHIVQNVCDTIVYVLGWVAVAFGE